MGSGHHARYEEYERWVKPSEVRDRGLARGHYEHLVDGDSGCSEYADCDADRLGPTHARGVLVGVVNWWGCSAGRADPGDGQLDAPRRPRILSVAVDTAAPFSPLDHCLQTA